LEKDKPEFHRKYFPIFQVPTPLTKAVKVKRNTRYQPKYATEKTKEKKWR